MANFKFVISHSKKSWQVEKDQKECPLVGKKIGETFSADFLGFNGYELQITGGSDKDGFPMRRDIEGMVKARTVIDSPPGFHPDKEGMRKRKTLRGNTISADIAQINCKVTKAGEKALEETLGEPGKKKEEGKKEDKEAEKAEKKEEKK